MIPQFRLTHLKSRKAFFEKHGQRLVFIRSRQWGAWWRPNSRGYTNKIDEAGVYTLVDAYAASGHCGPEKGIYYQFLKANE